MTSTIFLAAIDDNSGTDLRAYATEADRAADLHDLIADLWDDGDGPMPEDLDKALETVREGRTIFITVQDVPAPQITAGPNDAAYRAAATSAHNDDGVCEIDDGAIVSVSDDGGAYVQAWVWVDDEDAGICRKCRAANADNGEGWDGMCGDCADQDEGDE